MRRRTMIGGLLGTALFLGEKSVRAQSAPADVASSLAPTGRVRVAINYGNAVLAQRNPETGKLSGVSVDIAEELGRRLGVPLTLVPFDAAGKVSAAATKDIWDVAFLAGDPERAIRPWGRRLAEQPRPPISRPSWKASKQTDSSQKHWCATASPMPPSRHQVRAR